MTTVCIDDQCSQPTTCKTSCQAWVKIRWSTPDHSNPGSARCIPGDTAYDASGIPVEEVA